MGDGAKQVSVTLDDGGELVSIVFSGEGAPRDLECPNGQLGTDPMSFDEGDTLVGFQTVTVLAFKSAAGATRICVKLMNCRYYCA